MSQIDTFMSSDPLPPSKHRRSVVRRLTAIMLLVVAVIFIWLAVQLIQGATQSDDFEGAGSGQVVITVERGDSLTEIGRALEAAGVVKSVDAFIAAAGANDQAATLGPGKYSLQLQMSGESALALMLDPSSRDASRIVLPEGLRLNQTIDVASEATGIAKKDFRTALEDPAALGLPDWASDRPEGFLFPATYDTTGEEGAADLLQDFVRRFNQASADVGLVERSQAVGLSPYEVLIVASLLQAEGVPNDFAKVSRVIYNRLDAKMPLQLDSTVAYALDVTDISLSAEQLKAQSPYNTYENTGLPPTPINSPGEAAIEAALAPAKGKWLYFVTVNPDTKETKFTKNYDTFLKYKREFQAFLATQDNG
jgi:UPF0755 protein